MTMRLPASIKAHLRYRFTSGWTGPYRVLPPLEWTRGTVPASVPYVPLSHPFIERLIGTIRRECLDRTLFWTARDLEAKLLDFQRYFNEHRTHSGLNG